MTTDDRAQMERTLLALRPWLPHLVVVGGWAHRLHRLHPLSGRPAYEPVRTLDADIALFVRPPVAGDLGAALREAGFFAELSGDHTPPVTRYHLGTDNRGFFVEFLAPLEGGTVTRMGVPDATVKTAGVVAQKLRHLQILLLHPWTVAFDLGETDLPRQGVQVQVAHPVCFIAQRLLIQKERSAAKQAQDALYIHDTIDMLGHQRHVLQADWRQRIRPLLGEGLANKVEQVARARFGTVTDAIRSASRIPQDRVLHPEELQARAAAGLQAIFGYE
ncbi:MAG: GSU2403 family nucleotidyltransferase fold protein [Gemmatimonadales bacterium]